jgi:hypothetical protein
MTSTRALARVATPHPSSRRPRRSSRVARASSSAVEDETLQRISTSSSPFAAFAREEHCAPSVSYRSDVQDARALDGASYAAMSARWDDRARRELRDATFAVASVARVASNEILVQWSCEFVPAKLVWLYDLGLNWPLGTLEITKYDILDRAGETSTFSWKVLAQVFKRAIVEKKMRIPVAKIEGTSALTLDDDGKLKRHVESLALIGMVNAGRVRNKRVMRDVLEYLDIRKPPGMSLEDWDIQVESKVDIYSVPGMRQLDVDGMEDQNGNIEDVTAVLGFMTLILLTFSSVGFAWYMNGLKHEAMFREMLDTGAF